MNNFYCHCRKKIKSCVEHVNINIKSTFPVYMVIRLIIFDLQQNYKIDFVKN